MDAKSSFHRHKHADTICFHNTNSSNCGCECAGTRAACMRMNMFGMDVFAMARVRRACTWSLFSPCKLDENFAASTSYTNGALRLWSNRRYHCQDVRTCHPHNGPSRTLPGRPRNGGRIVAPVFVSTKTFWHRFRGHNSYPKKGPHNQSRIANFGLFFGGWSRPDLRPKNAKSQTSQNELAPPFRGMPAGTATRHGGLRKILRRGGGSRRVCYARHKETTQPPGGTTGAMALSQWTLRQIQLNLQKIFAGRRPRMWWAI